MPTLNEIILAFRSPETYPLLKTLRYAFYKDRQNRLSRKSRFDRSSSLPGKLIRIEMLSQGGVFSFELARLEVIFLTSDMVRISWTSGDEEKPPLPYAIQKIDWPPLEIGWHQESEHIQITSSELAISIYPDGGIAYQLSDGSLLRSDTPPRKIGQGWCSRALLREDESIHGMGEHAGPFNLRGQTRRLWNTDPGGNYGPSSDPIYMPIPVYLSIHGQGSYLVFYENYHRGQMVIDPIEPTGDAHISASFDAGMLRHYFIPGPPARAIERYTELTGRAGLPPRWSLGYHQSRWGYKEEKDVQEVVAGFRKHELPLSAIHLDIDYMDGYRVFTMDQNRFSDFGSMLRELKSAGIRTVTIVDPGIKKDPGFDIFNEGVRRGVFCRLPDGSLFTGLVWPGWTVFPDFTSHETRAWWGNYYERLLDVGVDGFWHDMNEPCSFSAWGGLEFPDNVCHYMEGQGGDHIAAHNIYALQMNRAGYEALIRLNPEHRPWLVSRSGWAGQQRYAWNWTGDTESTWNGLKMTLSTVLSLGLSGFPFTGPDIGGFSGAPTTELYLRWFQLATFLPFFRTHSASGTPRREPWVFGEPTTRIIRKFLRIRYQLLPYLYTLAWEAAQTGRPLVRPFFWYSDPNIVVQARSRTPEELFYLGEALLIAPIIEAGCTQRKIELSEGSWYDFWDNRLYESPCVIQTIVTLDRIPIFVKAGCMIPMEEGTSLFLHVYLNRLRDSSTSPCEFSAKVFSDAGDGYGAWRLDEFTIGQDGNTLIIHWDSQGEFPFNYGCVIIVLHGAAAVSASVDNDGATVTNGSISTGRFTQATIKFSLAKETI